MEGGKKCLCNVFRLTEEREFVKKMRFGASYSTSNKLLLVARHILTTGLQKKKKKKREREKEKRRWQCKFRNFMSPPSLVFVRGLFKLLF